MTGAPRLRVGIGYDSHRFASGRPLILGGQTIPFAHGLAGHSDADAVSHAVTDAILGASGAGDIGKLFPDDDPAWEDADSLELLRLAVRHAAQVGWVPVQADVTVIIERPKLASYIPAMEQRLAEALGLEAGLVNVKAKTNEGMGWVGRGEGVAVIAVATVEAR
jgi:2-C-methyl-D-erythritol 2,4-cyclodiphosphate synthase